MLGEKEGSGLLAEVMVPPAVSDSESADYTPARKVCRAQAIALISDRFVGATVVATKAYQDSDICFSVTKSAIDVITEASSLLLD